MAVDKTAMVEVIGSERDTCDLKVYVVRDFHPGVRPNALVGLAKRAGQEVKLPHPEQFTSNITRKVYMLRVGDRYDTDVTIIPKGGVEQKIPTEILASAILKEFLNRRTKAYDETLDFYTKHPEELIVDKEEAVV